MEEEKLDDEQIIIGRMVYVFDEGLWRLVEPALKDKSGRTEFTDDEDACSTRCLRDVCPDWTVEDVTDDEARKAGETKTRLTAPATWREAYAKYAREVEGARACAGLRHFFVCAAARLYGAVDKKDLADLVLHWWDEAKWLQEPHDEDTPEARREAAAETAEDLFALARMRASSPFAVAYVENGFVVSYDKYPPPESPDDPPDGALAKTLELRKGKERWDPDSLDDFLDWADDSYRDLPEEYDRLEDFILDTWELDVGDDDEMDDLDCVMDLVHDALAAGRGWMGAVNEIRGYFETAGMQPKSFSRLAKLLCDAANHTRQDANRGFTPEEMVAKHGLSGDIDYEAVHSGFADDPNAPVVRGTVKVGRNDPCPCGSGKKFKKCCGAG